MSVNIREAARQMKLSSPKMAAASAAQRNEALALVRETLQKHAEEIFAANREDLAAAKERDIPMQVQKRLKFDEAKLQSVCEGIDQLISLEDPLGKKLLSRELDEGLTLCRISCPIGVIGVIFEARPDALVQISSLCVKSGNCAILKGGTETAGTNRVLFELIHESLVQAGLPVWCLYQATERSEIAELLACNEDVDLLIPRGSNQFVQYIMQNTKIPVMGHADGVCHIYVDRSADFDEAVRVILDAKTQYPVACNTVETLLVHQDAADVFLPIIKKALDEAGVRIRALKETADVLGCEVMEEDDFHTEYGDLCLSLKIVADTAQAVDHINRYGSHHTDCILTQDDDAAAYFMQMVDSAGVYRNCSTRFADGFRYGFGAEVGISTGKLHARGPVGLEGLMTYKYCLSGSGQIVGDYASGRRQFHFRDLQDGPACTPDPAKEE